jgi:hypothetical protein
VPFKPGLIQSRKAVLVSTLNWLDAICVKQLVGENHSTKSGKRNEKLQPKHVEAGQIGATGHFLCLCLCHHRCLIHCGAHQLQKHFQFTHCNLKIGLVVNKAFLE